MFWTGGCLFERIVSRLTKNRFRSPRYDRRFWCGYIFWDHSCRKHPRPISAIANLICHLQIFFPRSIEGEIASRDAARDRKLESIKRKTHSQLNSRASRSISRGTYLLTSQNFSEGMSEVGGSKVSPRSPESVWLDVPRSQSQSQSQTPHAKQMRPNRRRGEDVELGGIGALTEQNLSHHNTRESQFNILAHKFTSPIGAWLFLCFCFGEWFF
jgi:hypothetical protein